MFIKQIQCAQGGTRLQVICLTANSRRPPLAAIASILILIKIKNGTHASLRSSIPPRKPSSWFALVTSLRLVPRVGLEPTCQKIGQEPQSCACTISPPGLTLG